MVRARRLELPRRLRHMHLKHACLPIPARARTYTIADIALAMQLIFLVRFLL